MVHRRDSVTRRQFLQGASALGAAAALGACTSDPDRAPSAASVSSPSTTTPPTTPTTPTDGTLVVLTLYGGNDALNTVAPVEDDTYRSLRGDLALDPALTHDLGEGFALHPSLVRCKALWDAERLAVVHGVGFDGLDRSHFHCMDVWQAGGPDDTTTGWLGRWLDRVGDDPLDAVAVGRGLPLLTRGRTRAAAVVPPGAFELPGGDGLPALLAVGARAESGPTSLTAMAARSTADLLRVAATVSPVLAGRPAADSLSGRLDTVATLIEAGLATRVYAVDLGGFDTHAGQATTHAALLSELDAGLGDFLERVVDRRVTVLVYSEFGRRVAPNASGGTDHGQAGTVLLAGTVRPGHHGEPPPLQHLTDGDLATTVDLRAVYGGVLEGVLGLDAADVLEGAVRPLDLV